MGLILKSTSDEIVNWISFMSRLYREGGSMRIISYHFSLEQTTRTTRSWNPYIRRISSQSQITRITNQQSWQSECSWCWWSVSPWQLPDLLKPDPVPPSAWSGATGQDRQPSPEMDVSLAPWWVRAVQSVSEVPVTSVEEQRTAMESVALAWDVWTMSASDRVTSTNICDKIVIVKIILW